MINNASRNSKLSHATILDMSCMRLTMVDERGEKKSKEQKSLVLWMLCHLHISKIRYGE